MKYYWLVWLASGVITMLAVNRPSLGPVFGVWFFIGFISMLFWGVWAASTKPPSYAYGSPTKSNQPKMPPVDGPMAKLNVTQQVLDPSTEDDEPAFDRPPWY